MKTLRVIIFLCIMIAGFLISAVNLLYAEEIIIIVNPNVPYEYLDQASINAIFEAEKSKWKNGETIKVAILLKGSTHDFFTNTILEKTPKAFIRIWKKVIFTGIGNLPNVFNNEEDLIKFVAETKGAIGYIDATASHKGTKKISIKK